MANIILEILQERRVMALLFLLLLAVGWVFLHGGPFGGGAPKLLKRSRKRQPAHSTSTITAKAHGLTELPAHTESIKM